MLACPTVNAVGAMHWDDMAAAESGNELVQEVMLLNKARGLRHGEHAGGRVVSPSGAPRLGVGALASSESGRED